MVTSSGDLCLDCYSPSRVKQASASCFGSYPNPSDAHDARQHASVDGTSPYGTIRKGYGAADFAQRRHPAGRAPVGHRSARRRPMARCERSPSSSAGRAAFEPRFDMC